MAVALDAAIRVHVDAAGSSDAAEIVSRGQASINGTGGDTESAEPAMRIINRIKLDMERAVEEMGAYP